MNVCYEAGTFICPILQIRKLSHRSNLPKITQPVGGRSQFLIRSVQLEFLLNHCTILPFFSFASLYHSLAITNPRFTKASSHFLCFGTMNRRSLKTLSCLSVPLLFK